MQGLPPQSASVWQSPSDEPPPGPLDELELPPEPLDALELAKALDVLELATTPLEELELAPAPFEDEAGTTTSPPHAAAAKVATVTSK
jgi:hypothetical protein